MSKIAFLACPTTLPGSPQRRADAFEHDLLFDALNAGLAGRAELTAIDWRAPLEQLALFDIAYLGTRLLAFSGLPARASDEATATIQTICPQGIVPCDDTKAVSDYVSFRIWDMREIQ